MPKNLGSGSHVETPVGQPDLIGPADSTEEPTPVEVEKEASADSDSQEHGTASDSLTVVRTPASDDGASATPSEPKAAPRQASASRSHAHKSAPTTKSTKSDDD